MKVLCRVCNRKLGERGSRFFDSDTVYDICPKCFRMYHPKEELLGVELYCFVCGQESKHFIDEWQNHWEIICRLCKAVVYYGKGD